MFIFIKDNRVVAVRESLTLKAATQICAKLNATNLTVWLMNTHEHLVYCPKDNILIGEHKMS